MTTTTASTSRTMVLRRRRMAAAAVFSATLAAGCLAADGVLRSPGGVPASAAGAAPLHPGRSVVARPGDTLWALAYAHHGPVDVRAYLDELIDRNGGTSIAAGQVVHLP